MNLTELLKTITPLPWVDLEEIPFPHDGVDDKALENANDIYCRHAANVLPELLRWAKNAEQYIGELDGGKRVRSKLHAAIRAAETIAEP